MYRFKFKVYDPQTRTYTIVRIKGETYEEAQKKLLSLLALERDNHVGLIDIKEL